MIRLSVISKVSFVLNTNKNCQLYHPIDWSWCSIIIVLHGLKQYFYSSGRERDLWVIIEYCPHGNLLDFLRKRREIFEATWTSPTEHADVTFTTIDLYICALQVARAMEFLVSRRVSLSYSVKTKNVMNEFDSYWWLNIFSSKVSSCFELNVVKPKPKSL